MSRDPLEVYEAISGTATLINSTMKEFASWQYFQNRELLSLRSPLEKPSSRLNFTDEADLWHDVMKHGQEAVKVSLDNFYLMEWIPQSPGLFYTPEAQRARKDALKYIQERIGQQVILDPYGKSRMINGGIGCLRLTLKPIGREQIKFLSATSSGVAHRGFIVAMREADYSQISQSLSTHGGIRCSLEGTLYYWNSQFNFEDNPLFFGQEVPRVYLTLDRIHNAREIVSPGLLNVTAAVIFSHKEQSEYTHENVIHWTYSQFDPAVPDSVKNCADWMQRKYVQSMHQGIVLTDFDEREGHIRGADLSLRRLMDPGTTSKNIAKFARDRLGVDNPSYIQIIENLYQIGDVGPGAIVHQGDIGDGAYVNVGTGKFVIVRDNKVTINENLLDPKFGTLGEELAKLRAEISALKTIPEQSRDQSVNTVKDLEEEIAKDHPDPTKVEEYLRSVKSILNTAGETYDAAKPWVIRIKKVVEALRTYAPLVGMTLAAFL
jgi:hypothetical protein